jgi:hypothetical protein
MQMNVALMTDIVSASVEIDGIKIDVSPGRVKIQPSAYTKDFSNQIADVITNLATTLPHTPMTAYGINFIFSEKIKSPVLHKTRALDKLTCDIENSDSIRIANSCKCDDSQMAFILEEKVKEKTLKFDFNFHFTKFKDEVPIIHLKNALIDGDIDKYFKKSQSFVDQILSTMPKAKVRK